MSCLYCCKKWFTIDNVKKVTFSDNVNVIYFEQTPIETNVCWQQVARDRSRFKRRILDVEQRIAYVLNNDHRKRIYKIVNNM